MPVHVVSTTGVGVTVEVVVVVVPPTSVSSLVCISVSVHWIALIPLITSFHASASAAINSPLVVMVVVPSQVLMPAAMFASNNFA